MSALERLAERVKWNQENGYTGCGVNVADLALAIAAIEAAQNIRQNWKNGGALEGCDDFSEALAALTKTEGE